LLTAVFGASVADSGVVASTPQRVSVDSWKRRMFCANVDVVFTARWLVVACLAVGMSTSAQAVSSTSVGAPTNRLNVLMVRCIKHLVLATRLPTRLPSTAVCIPWSVLQHS
jgi:hypothetical protein